MKGLKEAMKLIATEGMVEPEWRKRKIKDKIDKDFKKHKWTLHTYQSIDQDWQWRICCARIQLGIFDFEGWNLRRPRDGIIPTFNPQWDGDRSKRLLVLGEQGIGDEVMLAANFHHLPPCAIECDKRLVPIFERSFPQHKFFGRDKITDIPPGTYDAQCFMGDLVKKYPPTQFGTGYLIPDPDKVIKWTQELPHLNAVSWHGRQGDLKPDQLPKGISLQYGTEFHGKHYVPDIDLMNDIDDIFAILSVVEKVIGVPTSVHHFASAVGTECEVIMTMGQGEIFNALNWRWGMTDKTPWCPTARIHRNYADYQRVCKTESKNPRNRRIVGDDRAEVRATSL